MTSAEQIKSRLDVVTLIQSYFKLDKAGVNFKARCPFHSEKSASFYVSPAREIWHCFGCGKGGDIFSFVMEMEGVEFPEALRMLAERTGIELNRDGDHGERSIRVQLLALMEEATHFFETNLKSYPAALEYLKKRGLHETTIKDFRLGFAPDSWRAAGDHLKRRGYTDAEMEKAGLSISGERGPYDRFRSRIIFPLEDSMGRVIGFAGRILAASSEIPEKERAKYINTPQTVLYDKSRYLYGLGKAKQEIRRAKNIVVVEGNMDLILSHQAGVRNAVAVSGTALTELHVGLMRRLADSLIFAFDVDKAGIEASRRAVELAYAKDFHVKVVDITGGKDPADIVALDPARWRDMVAGATDSIAFFLKKAAGEAMSSVDSFSKKKVAEEILPMVARLGNEIEKAHWVRELASVLKIAEEALWRELERYKHADRASLPPEVKVGEPPGELTRKARLEEWIIGFILLKPHLASLIDMPAKADCSLAAAAELFELLQKRKEEVTIPEFLAALPEDLKYHAGRYLFEAEVSADQVGRHEDEFVDMFRSWKELSLKEKLAGLHDEISRLEVLGKKEESETYLKEFQALTMHLATVVSQHNYYIDDKKNKKENR